MCFVNVSTCCSEIGCSGVKAGGVNVSLLHLAWGVGAGGGELSKQAFGRFV